MEHKYYIEFGSQLNQKYHFKDLYTSGKRFRQLLKEFT